MPRSLSTVTSQPEQLPFIKASQLAMTDEFYVLDAVYQPRPGDTYGPQFRYKIRYKLGDGDGRNAYLTLPEGPAQRKELYDAFNQSKEAVGPMKLRYVQGSQGRWFYLLMGPDDTRYNQAPNPPPGGQHQEEFDLSDVDPDDLPF